MSNVLELFANLVKHEEHSLTSYQGIAEKDPRTLYFIRGTSLVYLGDKPYGSQVKKVTELPEIDDALKDIFYLLIGGDTAGLHVLNGEGTAFVAATLNRETVDALITQLLNDSDYDAQTGELKFKMPDGSFKVFSIPKDNFLSDFNWDAATYILTLKMQNGGEFDIDLGKLVDAKTPIAANLDQNATNDEAAGAKDTYELISGLVQILTFKTVG